MVVVVGVVWLHFSQVRGAAVPPAGLPVPVWGEPHAEEGGGRQADEVGRSSGFLHKH